MSSSIGASKFLARSEPGRAANLTNRLGAFLTGSIRSDWEPDPATCRWRRQGALTQEGRCAGERSSERKNLHGTFRRLMKVGGFFVLLVRDLITRKPNEHPNSPVQTRRGPLRFLPFGGQTPQNPFAATAVLTTRTKQTYPLGGGRSGRRTHNPDFGLRSPRRARQSFLIQGGRRGALHSMQRKKALNL